MDFVLAHHLAQPVREQGSKNPTRAITTSDSQAISDVEHQPNGHVTPLTKTSRGIYNSPFGVK